MHDCEIEREVYLCCQLKHTRSQAHALTTPSPLPFAVRRDCKNTLPSHPTTRYTRKQQQHTHTFIEGDDGQVDNNEESVLIDNNNNIVI